MCSELGRNPFVRYPYPLAVASHILTMTDTLDSFWSTVALRCYSGVSLHAPVDRPWCMPVWPKWLQCKDHPTMWHIHKRLTIIQTGPPQLAVNTIGYLNLLLQNTRSCSVICLVSLGTYFYALSTHCSRLAHCHRLAGVSC